MRRALAPMQLIVLPLMLTATIAGCMSMGGGNGSQLGDNPGNPGCQGNYGRSMGPGKTNALQDPWGNGVPLQGIYAANPPGNNFIAKQMLKDNRDPREVDYYDEKTLLAMNVALAQQGMPARPVLPGGMVVPKGLSPYPVVPGSQVMQAGYNTGQQPNSSWGYGNYQNNYYPSGYYPSYNPYAGYGGGEVIHAEIRSDGSADSGIRQAQYAQPSGGYGAGFGGSQPYCPPGQYPGMYPGAAGGYGGGMAMGGGNCPPAQPQRMQIKFTRPNGMKVYWYGRGPDGREMYSPYPLEVPGRYNFLQGATYRLKINNIEDRPLVELYPTLEVMPANVKTMDFLSHSAVPLGFTDEDFKQVLEGNYLVKVIYLPDPLYQDQAVDGINEIISTRLDPGQDPVQEARKRGTPLLIIRIGNVDQNLGSFSPPLNAGSSSAGSMPGSAGPGCMPGNPAWGPGGPSGYPGGAYCPPGGCPPGGCPPGGCPPGAGGYRPGMLPPTLSLGGEQMTPNFFNQRSLPQVPYMYWPYGSYANSPWCGQYCPPGCGQGTQQWCPPQNQQQGCPPWMGNPGANPGYNPGMTPPSGSGFGAGQDPKGASMDPPNRFRAFDLVDEELEKRRPRDLPPPVVDPKDDKTATKTDLPAPGGNVSNVPTSSKSLSSPLPLEVPGLNQPSSVPLVPPPSLPGDPASGATTGAVTPSAPFGQTELAAPPPGSIGPIMPGPGSSSPSSPQPGAMPSSLPAPVPPPAPASSVLPPLSLTGPAPTSSTPPPPTPANPQTGTSGLAPLPAVPAMPLPVPPLGSSAAPGASTLPAGQAVKDGPPPMPSPLGASSSPATGAPQSVLPLSVGLGTPPPFPASVSTPAGIGMAPDSTTAPIPVAPPAPSFPK